MPMEKLEFPAKIISQGRITIPDTFRELNSLKEGDIVIVTIKTSKPVSNLEMYLYTPEYLKPFKDKLLQDAKEKLYLAAFSFRNYALSLTVSSKPSESYKSVNMNTMFVLLGIKYLGGDGYGTYGVYLGSDLITKFSKSKSSEEEGVILFKYSIFKEQEINALQFYPSDCLSIEQLSGEGTLELEALGVAIMPPGALHVFQDYIPSKGFFKLKEAMLFQAREEH